MHWALLGVIALALVVLAYRYPRLAISLLAVLILLGLGGYWLQSKQQPGEAQISPEDVVFTAISIDPGYAGSWNLSARVHNQSLLTAIRELALRIEMFDCPPAAQSVSPTQCEVMGEVVKFIPLNVAPRERKNLEVNLIFSRVQPIHQLRWKYTVEKVNGTETDTVGGRRSRFPDLSISHMLRHLVGTE